MTQKFEVNGKKLLDLLTKSMKIIQPKSPIPMYSSGLLEIINNKLSITVTDMDHTLITHMEVIGDDCKFVVKIQDLFEIIKKFSGKITFLKEKNKVIIENENSRIELLLIEEEFIQLHKTNVSHIVKINIESFGKLFGFLPMTNEEWSFVFQINNNYLEAIASDRKRLIFSQVPITNINSEHFPLSFKTLNLLLKHVTGDVDIYLQQSQLIFQFIDGVLWSKFSNIPPINYQRILQKKQQGLKILVNRKALLDGLNRVSLLASNISKVIKLHFKENNLTLYASDASRGQAEENILIESNVIGSLSLNCEFLIAALKTIDSINVELYYTGQVSHFFITNYNTNYLLTHVIMPIVMNN
jgi:DNA polymerase-3 subunit beta